MKAIGIILEHSRHHDSTERLRKSVARVEVRLKELEAERERFLRTNVRKTSDSFQGTTAAAEMGGLRNSLREMYPELLIHYGFVSYCNGLAREEKTAKKK